MDNRDDGLIISTDIETNHYVEQPNHKKLIFSIILGLGIIILAILVSTIFIKRNSYTSSLKYTQIFSQKITTPSSTINPSSMIYTSPLGFSFVNPTSSKIQEYDFSQFCKNAQNPSAQEQPTTSSSSATNISFEGNSFDMNPEITVMKITTIGSISSQTLCVPGVPTPERLFYRKDTLYSDIQNLIASKIQAAQSQNFASTGINNRSQVTHYTNETSHVFGITNLLDISFVAADDQIFREYFLHDPSSQFLIYIRYPITCSQKDTFEKQENTELQNGTFNVVQHIKSLQSIADACEQQMGTKNVTYRILSSLTFTK